MYLKFLKMIKKNIVFLGILSYLTIMILPIICNVIIYDHAKSAIKKELTINSNQAMDKFKLSVDNSFVNISSIVKSLQVNKNIIKLYNMSNNTPYSDYSGNAFSVTDELKDILSANPFLSEVYIYYKNIDLVTSSRYMYTKELYYKQNFKDTDLSYEAWKAMFDKNCYATPVLISHKESNRQNVDIYYQIPEYIDKFDAVVVFSVDTATLLEYAKTITDFYSDIGVFILSKDNEVIMTNGVVDGIPENSKNFLVNNTVSDIIGWKYISVIPSKVFDDRLSYFKLLNIVNVIICLILGGILSYYFAKMNARPFNVLKMIYNIEDKNENDMTLINNALNDYRSAKQAQSELEQSNLMEDLISTGKVETLTKLKKYEIDFPYQYYSVILFKLINVSRLFEDENDITSIQKYDSVKLIIKNVLEELINEKHYVYIGKIKGQIVAVVNINNDYILDFQNDLEEILNRGKEFISSQFAFSYIPFVGSICDVKTLHKSYSEAITALQYRTFIANSDIVFCNNQSIDGRSSDVSAIIPTEKTKQLINLLQLGDEQTSLCMINTLLQSAPESPIKYRVFIFDLISTLIRAVESIDKDGTESKLSDEICRLSESSEPSTIQVKISEIVSEICKLRSINNVENESNGAEENLSERNIVSEIKDFINDNYTNQSLNIAMIGEYFNITPYYVSNIFKKSENMSMLEYISVMRIEKAKEMIVSTDLNLESIALQCGFTNIRTFMRVFQKFEVITPGKYKETHRKNA